MDLATNQPPVRLVDVELLRDLEMVSTKEFDLPGAVFNRSNFTDPRLQLSNIPGVQTLDKIALYRHIATIRHSKTDTFFVAFKQTMDCLMIEQHDVKQFPEWLMKSKNKKTELSIYIYQVKKGPDGLPIFPKNIPNLNSHEDWLTQISDQKVFETVAHFLLKNEAITIEMFEKM